MCELYSFFEISIYGFFCNDFYFLFNWNSPLAYAGSDINNSPALQKFTSNKSLAKNPWISHKFIVAFVFYCCWALQMCVPKNSNHNKSHHQRSKSICICFIGIESVAAWPQKNWQNQPWRERKRQWMRSARRNWTIKTIKILWFVWVIRFAK